MVLMILMVVMAIPTWFFAFGTSAMQLFVARLHELQKKHQAGSITVASELSTVLRDWLSLHIRRNDKELRTFFKQKKPGSRVVRTLK